MKVTLRRDKATEIMDALRADIAAEVRTGIHASDLLYPRKSYWEKTAPLPPTDDEINLWLAGRAHHYFLIKAVTGVDDTQEASLVNEELGISFSPDLLKLRGEFKTSRRWAVPKNEKEAEVLAGYYKEQCMTYAVCLGVQQWTLYVLYLSPASPTSKQKIPKFKVYDIDFTEQELTDHKQHLIDTRAALLSAIESKDCTGLEPCPKAWCYMTKGRGRNKQYIGVCKYFKQCNPLGDTV